MLGTQGGPRLNSTRAQPANLLIVNGTPYLFDAGNGVGRQLALARVPITTIGRIFITHNHDDHNADWGTLMGLAWSLGRREPIEVYGPRGTEAMRLGFLQYFVPNVANRTLHNAGVTPPASVFIAHDIEQDGLVYQDANITVTALENCHYHYVPGDPGHGWQKSYAMRVQTPDRLIVFSGDTGECGKPFLEFVRGASILVHEVVALPAIERHIRADPASRYNDAQIAELMAHMREEHTSPEDIGRLAAAAGAGQVVLTHLAPGSDDLPDAAYRDGVRQFYSGPVVVARDLMEIR
ncbi:MAG: MBL fold metallo-hydrolase [Gammaproteobacteria bacterium]|nr:MBL fold metallo-hydrolase [Gammaproteobacteria bacterium]